jgi:hypothetical protein
MGTNTGSAVEIWNPRIKAWRLEDIDHSMNLKGQPELLIRFLGVKHCPGFNELIGETHEERPVLSLDTRKHPLEVGGDDAKHAEARRIVISNWLSPHHATGSSSTTPLSSPLPSLSPSSLSPSPIFSELDLPPWSNAHQLEICDTVIGSATRHSTNLPAAVNPIPDYDSLWDQGYVHVPSPTSWPTGMYARDMAWGLTKLKEVRRDPEGRFRSVFPGTSFVKATFYRQLDAFFASTAEEIECCRALTRGAGGLWVDWRGSSSGWKKIAERKKQHSGNR